MSARKKRTQFASTEPDETGEGSRWSRSRFIWVGIAIVAAASSIVLGMVAFREADLREARELFENGNYRTAKIELRHFLKSNPGHAEAEVLLARTLIELRESPDIALGLFDRHSAATTDETHAWARANFMLQRWSAGIPLIAQVAKEQPSNKDAHQEWISALILLRMFEDAREAAQQYLDVGEHPADAELYLATIEYAVNDTQQSEVHLARVLELKPDASELRLTPADFFAMYAEVLLANGKPEPASEQAERSISFNPNPAAYLFLGRSLLQQGDEKKARLAFRECVLLDLNNSEARTQLALLDLAENKPEDALKWIGRLLSGDQVNSELAYIAVRCYQKLEDQDKVDEWSKQRRTLQQTEEKIAKLQEWQIDYPNVVESLLYRSWQLATEENWHEAQVLQDVLANHGDLYESEFGTQLAAAVKQKDSDNLPAIADFAFRPDNRGQDAPSEATNNSEDSK